MAIRVGHAPLAALVMATVRQVACCYDNEWWMHWSIHDVQAARVAHGTSPTMNNAGASRAVKMGDVYRYRQRDGRVLL